MYKSDKTMWRLISYDLAFIRTLP